MMLGSGSIQLSPLASIVISILLLLGSWLLYDFICKNSSENSQQTLIIIGFSIFIIMSYLLTHIYGSRAAYIHVGAIIGTLMAANVFRVIIPAQKNLVYAAENNQKPDLS